MRVAELNDDWPAWVAQNRGMVGDSRRRLGKRRDMVEGIGLGGAHREEGRLGVEAQRRGDGATNLGLTTTMTIDSRFWFLVSFSFTPKNAEAQWWFAGWVRIEV